MPTVNPVSLGSAPSPSRRGHADADWARLEREEADNASRFIRLSGLIASTAVIVAAVILPMMASGSCRGELTSVDSWAWLAGGVVALGYFWLRSLPGDDSTYRQMEAAAYGSDVERALVRRSATPMLPEGSTDVLRGCERLYMEDGASSPCAQSPLHARSPNLRLQLSPFTPASPSRSNSFPTETNRRCKPGQRIQAMQAAISGSPLHGQDSPAKSPRSVLEALAEADPRSCSASPVRAADLSPCWERRDEQDGSSPLGASPDVRQRLLFDGESQGRQPSFCLDDCPPVPAEVGKQDSLGPKERDVIMTLKELAYGSFPRLPLWVYGSAFSVLGVLVFVACAQPPPAGVTEHAAFMSGSNAANASETSSKFMDNSSRPSSDAPFWATGPWSHCSVGCGTGEKHRNVTCVNGEREDCERVESTPSSNTSCREYSGCQWTAGPWGACDAQCGEGHRHREVLCTNSQIQDCFKVLFTVPPESKKCINTSRCSWRVGEWGQCSNTCGEGEQQREVKCGNGEERFCEQQSERPDDRRTCTNFDSCAWRASRWSSCSNTCGNGTRTRQVECMSKSTEECEKLFGKPPASEETCRDTSGCRWSVGKWSECSSTCGTGVQTRDVECDNGHEEDCAAGSDPKPNSTRQCTETSRCIWTSSWSQCTSVCGTGRRTREASCSNGAPDGCKDSAKKVATLNETCHSTAGCEWATGPWSACSNDCGDGEQTREVGCGNGMEGDCAKTTQARPRQRRACRGSAGCEAAAAAAERSCSLADPVVRVSGACNALVGWLLGFAGLHELSRRGWLPRPRGGKALLSPAAVLVAGLTALACAVLLRPHAGSLGEAGKAGQASVSGGLLAVGLVGMSLWATSLFGRGAACEGGHSWKAQAVWLFSSAVLLSLCCVALFYAFHLGDAGEDGRSEDGRKLERRWEHPTLYS